MAADLGLVADAADREPDELAAERVRDRMAERGLADAGRADETQDLARDLLPQLGDGEVLDDAVLHLLEVEMVGVEDLAGVCEVEVVVGERSPRERQDPLEVGADHAVLRGRRRQLLEPAELALCRLGDVLRQRQLAETLAQLVHFRLLGVGLAELLLDRLELLAEEVLALPLLHLRLHLRLDLRAQLEDLELATQDRRDLPQALLDVECLEQLLALLGPDRPQRRGDEVRERTRIVDVRRGELQLLRQIRSEPDDAREETLDVPGERLELRCLDDDVRERAELAEQVRVGVDAVVEADALEPLHEDPECPVGNLDHLVDEGDRADVVDVVPARRFDGFVARRDQREQAVACDDVVDQPDRALLPDRERRHRLREDDRLLEREHGQCGRQLGCLIRGLGCVEPEVAHAALLAARALMPARLRS